LLNPTPAAAQFIWIDCSFKAVLNPTNGLPYYPFTEADIDATLDQANQYLAGYQRGYRMRRVGLIYYIGGPAQEGTNGPSKWYYMDPPAAYPGFEDAQHAMDFEATNNPTIYHWNFQAINYYILGSTESPTNANGQAIGLAWGAGCDPPEQIITFRTVHMPMVILHETGHWFDLMHPHGRCASGPGVPCGDPSVCSTNINGYWLGDDGFPDTLPTQAGDLCFTNQELIALANFAIPYTNCSPVQSNLVDDVYLNLMSYGTGQVGDRLTPQQLDGWTDIANGPRAFAMSGLTRYVSPGGHDFNSGLTNTEPKRTVLNAVNSSSPSGSDIVLLRPGQYNEQFTITRPVTLRAAPTNSFPAYPRWATIGKP
jgi:hypothetical protein